MKDASLQSFGGFTIVCMWLYYSHISLPFGHVALNFIDVMEGNIFGLADPNKGEITETSQKSYLTSKFSHVYKVYYYFSQSSLHLILRFTIGVYWIVTFHWQLCVNRLHLNHIDNIADHEKAGRLHVALLQRWSWRRGGGRSAQQWRKFNRHQRLPVGHGRWASTKPLPIWQNIRRPSIN